MWVSSANRMKGVLKIWNLSLPARCCGSEAARPRQGAWVQSLVRELRSCMQHSVSKKRKQIETWMWGQEKDGPGRRKCEKSLSLSQGDIMGQQVAQAQCLGKSLWHAMAVSQEDPSGI